MNLPRHFRTAFGLSILLMVFSVPVGAGTYDAEMVKMAKAIEASFDQKQQVKTIAVLDFTDLQGTVTELGKFLAEELSADLVMGQKQFDVIDRANLKRLLDENKLSRSGLVDPEAIKRLGKMAGADALVTGTVTPLGNTLRVSARIINTETARIVGAAQVNVDKTPEISELLRARVVESGSSGTVAAPSIPTGSARTPTRKVKLTYEDKSFRATVASASFDKSSNQMTLLIDFTNLLERVNVCLAAVGSESILAVDDFSGQWDLVRMVGIQGPQSPSSDINSSNDRSRYLIPTPPSFFSPQDSALISALRSSWSQIRPGASHRFAIVLAPRKADSSLTLNLTLGLYVKNLDGAGWPKCFDSPPAQISIGFDGIVATR